ncbi:MAG: M15 family metallopeptidase [Actinomycetota bacterium]|nr:M15 family metallopeptidase [Actinomycetota bacterium]
MSSVRALPAYAASALVGVMVGALVVMGVDGVTRGRDPATSLRSGTSTSSTSSAPAEAGSGTGSIPTAEPAVRQDSTILLAWASGGLPRETEQVLERTDGVSSATTILSNIDWIRSSRLADGTPMDDPPQGLAIPWDVALVDPTGYARFVPPGERDLVLGLEPGEVLLSETEAQLRGAGTGLQVSLEDRQLTVTGVISDVAANGYEALVSGGVPASWTDPDRFVLAHLDRPSARPRLERTVEKLLGPGQALRSRALGETPFLRYGDAVQPQMYIKETFGEFAARPSADGSLELDPAWRKRNIVTTNVPVLGEVTCHRVLIPQMRQGLKEVRARGLAYAINTEQYGGCFGPRFINRDPTGRLSHHAWGIAFDINVAENAFGTKADLDRSVVEILERWGFTWGGRWLVPDGMHFEWQRFP